MARSNYESLTREDLLAVIERLEARIVQQDARIKQPDDLLDQATRSGKRQAAPFSKGAPKPSPQKPGRKPGEAHGRHGHREPPTTPPDQIIDVPMPLSCPDCGGTVQKETVVEQHQLEIPRRPIHRRFDLHVGRCRQCGRRLQPRHPLQTSNAPNARSQAHLRNHRDELFTFLYDPRFDATNWRAEQAIRPAVVNRKVFGGNRTLAGAHALEILASLFATCRQHRQDALEYLSTLLRAPPANLIPLPLPIPKTNHSKRR